MAVSYKSVLEAVQAFVICGVLSAQGPPKMSVKDWSCGFTETQKQYTYDLLEGSCAKYKAAVNLCCAEHRDCLKQNIDSEKEVKECNADLCLCLEVPANEDDGCGYKVYESCYNALMNIKFIVVKMHFHQIEDTYEAVMPYGFVEESVRNVYDECGVAQKYSTRACAVRHNECHLQGMQDCEEDFKYCMVCANMKINEPRDQEESCSLAIAGLKRDASLDHSRSSMPPAPPALTKVPSETLTTHVKEGCPTLATYIPVLVTVAVICMAGCFCTMCLLLMSKKGWKIGSKGGCTLDDRCHSCH
ncbi:unnamed protein product [Cylicocyclus nassatus]|uniref:Uncharacterized protein n=1 Tax=Cylicocyclus nassatus TaxID=53992 RepID=A0AA36DMB2_CYLNA|nr:unnamed protein product [Cylicocyclus nassatus]